MEGRFNLISLSLFLLALATLILIFRDAFPLLNLDDQATFRRWMGRKLGPRTRAIDDIWKQHARSFPKSRKRVLFVIFLIGAVVSVVAYQLWLSPLRRLGYVDSAIGSMRVLVATQARFAQVHPDLGYACALSALPSDEITAELIKNGRKNGYAFEISGCHTADGERRNTKYQLTARPLVTGMPAFCSNQSGVVRYDETGSVQKCLQNGVPVG
jgi:hypothetical protein